MSVGLAARAAGVDIVGVLGRTDVESAAARLNAQALSWEEAFPPADLVIVAVRDDAIGSVASMVALQTAAPLIHLSGKAGLDELGEGERGSFHPLQTLPSPEAGWRRLAGAGAAISASSAAVDELLWSLAERLGMQPFRVPDEARALYHAAAAASANFVVTVLDLAHRLFRAAGVDPGVARQLTDAVVANTYELGPNEALTGPVARGDVGTVAAQRAAVAEVGPEAAAAFDLLVGLTARLAGTSDLFQDVDP